MLSLAELFGRVGPSDTKHPVCGRTRGIWGRLRPQPWPQRCCLYLPGLLNYQKPRIRRFSFWHPMVTSIRRSRLGRTVCPAGGKPVRSKQRVFQSSTLIQKKGDPGNRKRRRKGVASHVRFCPIFSLWSGASVSKSKMHV